MKLRATVVVEYRADPADYETYDAAEAARVDEANWKNEPIAFFSSFDDEDYQITVEPVGA